jgi:DNA-binding PadR family transcriptional regulator
VADLYGNPNEGKGLAARVIVHLASLARLGPNDIATLEYTQQGMVALFGVRQGSLTKVLLRLLAGEAVTVERRYVGGASQRLKVYRLTALGESLARDLRRRATPPPPTPAEESGWVPPRRPAGRAISDRDQWGA